jgi:ketosteroid isomerase-like protein
MRTDNTHMIWRRAVFCLCIGWASTADLRLVPLAAPGVPAPALAEAGQRVKSDQETLMELEREWDAAFRRNDVKFIASILADEFIATYDDGTRADKAKELELAANFNQQIDSSSLDEFTIHTFRDTAVVWFTLRLVGPMQGRRVEIAYRYLDVWVFRDGRWLCVASQSTRLMEKK